jgi:hypothetical protein
MVRTHVNAHAYEATTKVGKDYPLPWTGCAFEWTQPSFGQQVHFAIHFLVFQARHKSYRLARIVLPSAAPARHAPICCSGRYIWHLPTDHAPEGSVETCFVVDLSIAEAHHVESL